MKDNKEYTSKDQEKLDKKISRAGETFEASALFTGLVGGMAAIALLLGGTANAVADWSMNQFAPGIYIKDEYQEWVRQTINGLTDDFTTGKISYEEYANACNEVLSTEGVIDYSKVANDEELNLFVTSYQDSKDVYEGTIKKGFPAFTGMAAVGGAGMVASHAVLKKRKKEKEELEEGSVEKSL